MAIRTPLEDPTGSRVEDERGAHVVSVVEHNAGGIVDADQCRRGEGELAAARRVDPTAAAGKAGIAAETTDAPYANAPDAGRAVENGGRCLVKVKRTRPGSSKT